MCFSYFFALVFLLYVLSDGVYIVSGIESTLIQNNIVERFFYIETYICENAVYPFSSFRLVYFFTIFFFEKIFFFCRYVKFCCCSAANAAAVAAFLYRERGDNDVVFVYFILNLSHFPF